MYEDVFERKFLVATDNLYAAEGQKYMQDNDVSEFCTPWGWREFLNLTCLCVEFLELLKPISITRENSSYNESGENLQSRTIFMFIYFFNVICSEVSFV